MRTFVWLDSWQQQCCGEDFRVGSEVAWQVVPQDSPHEWTELLLGKDWAAKIEFREEHHSDDELPTIRGSVRSIFEVTCQRIAQPEGTGHTLVPIPGSGATNQVAVADKWSPEPSDALQEKMTFDGWIVELELATDAVT